MKLKILGKKGLSGASEILLIAMMVLALALLVLMPWWLRFYLDRRVTADYYYQYLVLLYISGTIAEVLMFCGSRLMHNINAKKPFIMQNARLIRCIAYCCLSVAVVYLVATFFLPSFFMPLIALVFTVITVVCFVFAELFKQAVLFKEENELTI